MQTMNRKVLNIHVYSHRYYNIAYYYVKPRFRVCRSVSKKPPIQMFLDDME